MYYRVSRFNLPSLGATGSGCSYLEALAGK